MTDSVWSCVLPTTLIAAVTGLGAVGGEAAAADEPGPFRETYLADVCRELNKAWPSNRTVTIVCHGHSVPAGYFVTPRVDTFNAYPHLLHKALNERFPNAVINVIVTAIGGEDAESGAARFARDVLSHRPDVVTIDYALNDRRIGLDRARKAWAAMIAQAQAAGVKVILLTPTADMDIKFDDPNDPACQHAEQVRALAREYRVGLADSFAAYQQYVKNGGKVADLLSQFNHPNRQGHELVVRELLPWFPR